MGLGVAVNGRFIMSCSAINQLVVWDLKGSVLAVVDTCLLNTFRAKVSPCGRFVVASGRVEMCFVCKQFLNRSLRHWGTVEF